MSDNSQYREMFVSESLEHIETMNQALLKLEQEPSVKEHIDLVFRAAHTVKGMSATMGYDQIRELCKSIEDEFEKFRKGQEKPTSALISTIFKRIDLLQQLIEDEKKQVDLKPFLEMNANPEESKLSGQMDSFNPQLKSPTIRVKMEDLDILVNLVGELVISKMRLEQTTDNESKDSLQQVITTFDRLITDLQHQSMKLRLVPIDQIFSRFPRLVRDLSTKLKKDIKLETDGNGIELDRTVLDAITDPLLHMIINSVDHGLENPDERKQAGKSETCTIKLSAYRIDDKVAIRIDDDGRGINLDAIKNKAIKKKIITREEGDEMSTKDVIALLGTPGLSTAKEITEISGRGVGMDVVISQVESVGGSVKIETTKGQGTSITLTMPLSLSIIGGLLVNVSDQKFVLPLSSIRTIATIPKNKIKSIKGKEVIVLRGEVISLLYVREILGLGECKKNNDSVTIVIVDKAGKSFGLVIDSFDRKQEIVIKRLSDFGNKSSMFTNATILPDGKVALILDPALILKTE